MSDEEVMDFVVTVGGMDLYALQCQEGYQWKL